MKKTSLSQHRRQGRGLWALGFFIVLVAAGCGSQEAVRVSLPVVVDGSGLLKVQTDLGYQVQMSLFRLAVKDLQFTVRGEMHASLLQRAANLLVPRAYAHPGHYSGGDVTGELPGTYVLDFSKEDGRALGKASLITGAYQGSNFTFRKTGAADSLASTDPLLGHTAHIEGLASRGGQVISFKAQVDVDEGSQLVGAPFAIDVTETTQASLGFKLLAQDPVLTKTLFDGIDFAALDPDGDGQVAMVPGQDAHNLLRRNVQVHDFYAITNR